MTAARLSPELVAGVAREIDARRGARIRTVHQDGPLAFRLDLRGAERADLVIDLGMPVPRVHLAPPRPAPPRPTPLAGGLRKLIAGSKLEGAEAVPGERALCLRLRAGSEPRSLWVELFGGQANLYVLDGEGTVALTPRGAVAARRGASRGAAFEPVPARGEAGEPAPEASAAVRAMVHAAGTTRRRGSARARLRRLVKRRLAGARKARRRLEDALAAGEEADAWHRRGTLLQGSFDRLRPGQSRVVVTAWDEEPPREVEIELDPRLEPGEQVAACFRRERKLRRRAAEAAARLADQAALVEALEEAARQLEGEGGEEDERDGEALLALLPQALATEARALLAASPEAGPRGRRGPARARPWHAFTSADGWRILVGRDARGNDELTLRRAAPHDLFLHVRAAAGSHVIVPTPRGKTVPKDTLLDAAELACHHSERAAAEHNEVDYTPRRYVRKPRGAAPGLVRLERARTLAVRRDPARRARLLATRGGPDEPGPGPAGGSGPPAHEAADGTM